MEWTTWRGAAAELLVVGLRRGGMGGTAQAKAYATGLSGRFMEGASRRTLRAVHRLKACATYSHSLGFIGIGEKEAEIREKEAS